MELSPWVCQVDGSDEDDPVQGLRVGVEPRRKYLRRSFKLGCESSLENLDGRVTEAFAFDDDAVGNKSKD